MSRNSIIISDLASLDNLPNTITSIEFSSSFNQLIAGVKWPSGLQSLTFAWFNQPISEVKWPSSLLTLSLGNRFNQPISGVKWPPNLQTLTFGQKFNQPISEVKWPPYLQTLSFGNDFNQPISGVKWPLNLQTLSFNIDFNQPISEVKWPPNLRDLIFSWNFNQPIAKVRWPPNLRTLSFGEKFNQPISEVKWSPNLQYLTFGYDFNQPISEVKWPPNLQGLVFGNHFNQPISEVKWPPNLRTLASGNRFNQPISEVKWPPNLQNLYFGYDFNQPISEVNWPRQIEVYREYHDDEGKSVRELIYPTPHQLGGLSMSHAQLLTQLSQALTTNQLKFSDVVYPTSTDIREAYRTIIKTNLVKLTKKQLTELLGELSRDQDIRQFMNLSRPDLIALLMERISGLEPKLNNFPLFEDYKVVSPEIASEAKQLARTVKVDQGMSALSDQELTELVDIIPDVVADLRRKGL